MTTAPFPIKAEMSALKVPWTRPDETAS